MAVSSALRSFYIPTEDVHSYKTRSTQRKLLNIPRVNAALFGTIFFKGPSTWNNHVNISKQILDIKTQYSVKKCLKDFFVNRYKPSK